MVPSECITRLDTRGTSVASSSWTAGRERPRRLSPCSRRSWAAVRSATGSKPGGTSLRAKSCRTAFGTTPRGHQHSSRLTLKPSPIAPPATRPGCFPGTSASRSAGWTRSSLTSHAYRTCPLRFSGRRREEPGLRPAECTAGKGVCHYTRPRCSMTLRTSCRKIDPTAWSQPSAEFCNAAQIPAA